MNAKMAFPLVARFLGAAILQYLVLAVRSTGCVPELPSAKGLKPPAWLIGKCPKMRPDAELFRFKPLHRV